MKRLLITLTILLGSFSLSASHLLGGEIWWECQPSGRYVFFLRIYRDCTGIPMPSPGSLNSNSPAGSMPLTLVTGYPHDVSPSGPNCVGTDNINCGAPQTGAIEEYLYRTPAVILNGVPPASGWYFTWLQNARPNGMANITSGSYFLRAMMYPYNNGTGNLNANPCYDNSPLFLQAPKVVTCTDYEFSFNNFAFDEELDSLYFDWAQPLYSSFATPVNFTNGYSFNNPLPGIQSFAQDAGQVTINTNLTGKYATCMKVTAYKCNQKVAEIFRDIPVILLPCVTSPTNPSNVPPTLQVINDPAPMPQLDPVVVNGDTTFYEMTVYAGEYIHFRMQSVDSDFDANWTPQTIKFVGVGGNLGTPVGNPNNCIINPPCATITPTAPQTSLTTTLTNNVDFSWQTDCGHLNSTTVACGKPKSSYLFYFKMEDNYCPAPSFKLISARINVISPEPVAPDMTNQCMNYDPTTNSMTLGFVGPAPADTAQNFDYYVVFRGDGNTFSPIDTVLNYSDVAYTDLNPDTAELYYFMRTYGGCDQESEPSDTLIAINPTMVPFPVIDPYVAQLSWNAPRVDTSLVFTYEIWRQITGANDWQMLGQTNNRFYSDTINLCKESVDYQIRLAGGCGSFLASDTLADKVNEDVLDINYVTVNNGQTVIDFKPTKYDDVIEYHVLIHDGTSWQLQEVIPVPVTLPYTLATSDPTIASERLKVVSRDSCYNFSDTSAVLMHQTLFLDGILDVCDGSIELKWNQYNNWPGDVDNYQIMADVTVGGTTNSGVLIGTNPGTDTTFIQQNLLSGAEYCYYIVATDTSGLVTSTSNEYCIQSDVVIQSQLQYMARATVQIDGSVETWTFIDGRADVDEYQVQRAEDTLGPWLTVGVVPMPTSAPYQIKFVDFSANTDEARYFYRVRSANSCGGIDTVSNYGTNILLEVSSNENLTNQLTWNAYRDYGGIVDHYNIYRKADNSPNWVLVANDVKETSYSDNIRQFGNGKGIFCYRVAAVEANNPLGYVDETGNPMTSFSNEVCVDLDARGFFPTAFTPNSSIPENRVWKPHTLFEDASEYDLSIVDRWGNRVFHTNAPDEGWDGSFRGDDSPEGVYFFVLKYRSEGGKLKEERGSITLIR